MSSITIPVKVQEHPHVRALNVIRDLSTVADLIELCFSNTMDNDGQRYLSDMRQPRRRLGRKMGDTFAYNDQAQRRASAPG